MSHDGVYQNDMPRSQPSDEQWPTGDSVLAAFADDLRTIAGGPAPEPRAGLRAVMSQGQGRSVPIDSSPGRRKMLVKTLVGSLAAKVAFGMGVAAASVTAAGAAGVLPDPAQHAVASVVSATTPFALPDPSDVTLQVGDDTGTSTSTTTPSIPTSTPTSTPTSGDDEGGTRTLNHGACVSAVAKTKTDDGSHGKTVSSVARSDCGKTDPVVSSTTSTTVAGSSTTSTTSTTIAGSSQRTGNSGPGNSGNNGNGGNGSNGNGGNRGQGNSGKG